MEENNVGNGTQLLLKRTIPVKVVVTPLWKKEMQEQLERQIEATDAQMQQLEFQGKRAIADDGDGLAVQQIQVGVSVVVEAGHSRAG